ncbi:MAG: ATP-binding cassette domain-containing protein, partial [Pseudomonadales bacterium]|nr:ATP-binding cassette domain-containing protein [Pseudomonadales bacterium]
VNENAKKKAQISELREFVSRFSANASKAKQATSRAKQIDKIQIHHIKPSSRANPYIIFEQEKKLHRLALTAENISHGFDGVELFSGTDLMINAGERVAIIGENGAGKTTLMKILIGEITPNTGSLKWAENATQGYYAQDHEYIFDAKKNLQEWMEQWRTEKHDEQIVRSILGRLLFKGDTIEKKSTVCSGGEKGRLLFGKLMMQHDNVLVLDEPTNHMDMESIESINLALDNYDGTLFFVSHDREFVSSLATRILEIKDNKIHDFQGTYEEYLKSQGINSI